MSPKILDALGVAYGELKDAPRMLEMLERALTIQERVYGEEHARIATTLTNLGTAC